MAEKRKKGKAKAKKDAGNPFQRILRTIQGKKERPPKPSKSEIGFLGIRG